MKKLWSCPIKSHRGRRRISDGSWEGRGFESKDVVKYLGWNIVERAVRGRSAASELSPTIEAGQTIAPISPRDLQGRLVGKIIALVWHSVCGEIRRRDVGGAKSRPSQPEAKRAARTLEGISGKKEARYYITSILRVHKAIS